MPRSFPPPGTVLANYWPALPSWPAWRAFVFELPRNGGVWLVAVHLLTGKTVTAGGDRYEPTADALRERIRQAA